MSSNMIWRKRTKYYRATAESGQLTFVSNPHNYPIMDGDTVYVDTSVPGLPIVAHSISPMCVKVQLLLDVVEVEQPEAWYENNT